MFNKFKKFSLPHTKIWNFRAIKYAPCKTISISIIASFEFIFVTNVWSASLALDLAI